MYFIFLRLIKQEQRERRNSPEALSPILDPAARKRIRWSIRLNKLFVVMMASALVFGLSQIREAPLMASLVGIAVNQVFMWSSIRQIRTLENRLKQPATS
jgi:hypothetical protein